MEIRDWITLVIVPGVSIIASAIAGIWFWLTKSYLPAQQKRHEEIIQAKIAEQEDTREFRQQSEMSSLNVLIENQKLLTDSLLRYTDRDLKDILSELKSMRGELQKIAGNSSLQTREWSKIEEVLEDIDLMYHRITGILEGIIIGDENA